MLGYKFEIVPAVGYEDNPDLYDTPATGSKEWMQCYPNVPSRWLSSSNHANNRMFIPLIKILKQWNRHNNVRFKSFHLELLTEKVFGAITEIKSYPQGIFDWMYCVKNWVWDNEYPFVQEPGKSFVYVDDYLYQNKHQLRIARNKLDAGLKKAERAWNFYCKGRNISAKMIWHNMFGNMFPSSEPLPAKPVLIPPKTEPAPVLKNALTMQQPAGLIGGYHTNALLEALANPSSKPSDIPVSNSARNNIFDALLNPQPKPTNILSSDISRIIDLLTKSKDPFKK